MRKATDQKFGQAFNDWLKQSKLEGGFNSTKALEAWPIVMGPMVARHTTSIRIAEGVLYVSLDSAPLRQELFQSREQILKSMNEAAGSDVLKEVVFR
ncbi:MAG: hypothetical protein RL021_656 [Bacteroidota bacterium]|jgi:predicted nucleic acid-binding Zn ribbon protein